MIAVWGTLRRSEAVNLVGNSIQASASPSGGSHKIILQVDQCQCTADIGGFIDRSAVVGGHHAAQKRAQQQAAAALHLGQAERHPPVEAAQRRIDDHKHQPADE